MSKVLLSIGMLELTEDEQGRLSMQIGQSSFLPSPANARLIAESLNLWASQYSFKVAERNMKPDGNGTFVRFQET